MSLNTPQRSFQNLADLTHLVFLAIPNVPNLQVRGKSVSPVILFSESFAGPLLYWHACNNAYALHEKSMLEMKIVCDLDTASGMRISSYHPEKHILGLGLEAPDALPISSVLLLVLNSAHALVKPAIERKPIDYENVLLRVKSIIEQHYDAGSEIRIDDQFIGREIQRSLNDLSSSVSPKNQKGE